MKNKIFTGVFALLLFGLAILTLALPKKTFSETENRTLAALPKPTKETVLDGQFTAGFAKWLSDHYAGRDLFVSVKSGFDLLLGAREHGGVYLTNKGLVDSFTEKDAKEFDKNIGAVEAFQQKLTAYGADFRLLIAPTGTEVYADRLPAGAPVLDAAPLFDRLRENAAFVDLTGVFAAHRDEDLFYTTDHHWTARGAYLAYCEWMNARGETPKTEADFKLETVTDSFYGTLYSRFGLFLPVFRDTLVAPAAEALGHVTRTNSKGEAFDSLYAPETLTGKDKYLYFLGGNDSIVELTTDAGTGKSLLLVKDSYANAFLPYVMPEFDRVTVIDLRYYSMDVVMNLVKNNAYTDVLVLYNLKSFASDRNLELLPLE